MHCELCIVHYYYLCVRYEKILSVIIFSLSLLVFGSCGDRRVDAVLNDADTLMFSRPDSAVAMLDSLDLSSASRFQRARHALLLTKACSKNNCRVADDSLISLAVNEFSGRADSLETQAIFYRGYVLNNRRDYSSALISLMEAVDRAAETGDEFYRAMAYREQADIYYSLLAHSKRCELSLLAARYFDLANKPLHAAWEKVSAAFSYTKIQKPDSAIEVLQEVMPSVFASDDIMLKADWFKTKAFAQYSKGDDRGVINSYLNVNDLGVDLETFDNFIKGLSYRGLGLGDSAELCLRKASVNSKNAIDSQCVYKLRSLLNEDRGNIEQALDDARSYDYSSNSNIDHVLTQSYAASLVDHYSDLLDERTIQRERDRIFSTLIIVIFVITIVVMVVIRRFQSEKHRLNLESLKAKIDSLELTSKEILQNLSHVNAENYILSDAYYSWLRTYKKVSNDLFFISSQDNAISKLLCQNGETFVLLESIANATKDDIMTRFRQLPVKLSQSNYNLALLMFLDFSPQAICAILKLNSVKTFSVYKHRLKVLLKEIDPNDVSEFLSYFE